ncbi:MAG: FAD-dependent oxidoreductase [Bacteroidetes bacterium]|nr:FAD-dependent oxidoreductase [Bacteroidota bacterium]
MTEEKKFDVLIIGGGIAGQEAALSLANMDYQVLMVEKGLSIGGKMIQLSKVFPTLDCAACITTPKMSETARHENITLALNSDIQDIRKNEKGFDIEVLKNPRYVIPEACTGCQECEIACPEVRSDEYNRHLAGRKVAYIPFSLANPRIATIDRQGTSAPCIAACPGGVKPYGYITLVRNGQYEEAMQLHMEDIPLPGSLGRACYAPCQGECTRSGLEASVDIRKIKRFFAEDFYNKYPVPPARTIGDSSGKKVAIVGSGPAGLTAAYHLALAGHHVKIFEAAREAGGMLKLTLPEYRLPNAVVDRDILNVTSLGVEIELNHRVENISDLKDAGFDVVFISVGTHETTRLGLPGSEAEGIVSCLDFLRESKIGKKEDLKGKRVMVIGGGNTAMDASRTALRLGAEKVSIVYRRGREEMPAWKDEILEAEEEGIDFQLLRNPVGLEVKDGKLTGVKLIRMELGHPDASGRKKPVEVKGSEYLEPVDLIIEAIGLQPSTSVFGGALKLHQNGTIQTAHKTLQTSIPWVFAGGDAVTGSTTIIEAAEQGKQAAFYIDKYLRGLEMEAFEFGDKLPAIDKAPILSGKDIIRQLPVDGTMRSPETRCHDFQEIERTFTEEEVRMSAERCLDCSNCRECHQCVTACPAYAIDFAQKPETIRAYTGAVIIASGFQLFDPALKPHYGSERFPNVIDSLQMDRLIAPTRPFNNVLRPSDGKVPGNIAYVLCTGSRDASLDNYRTCSMASANNPICSQICCMYSIKQAQLLMGALPMADISIYYIDIRAFGKGYDEFYQQSKSMGINFIKGKVARVMEKTGSNGDVILRVEDVESGQVKEFTHDLVVLSVGVLPDNGVMKSFNHQVPELDEFRFIRQVDPLMNPARTSVDGVFVAGTAAAPMDIPDSILSAGAAASEVAAYLSQSVNQ